MRKQIPAVTIVIGLMGMSSWADTSYTVRVNGETRYQTFEGFGGTITPFEEDGVFNRHDPRVPVVVSATDSQKEAIAALIYGSAAGQLGFSRSRTFPRRFEESNDNNNPFVFDEQKYDWLLTDSIIDFVRMAHRRGLKTHFTSFGGGLVEEWLRLMDGNNRRTCQLNPELVDEYVEMELRAAMRFRERGMPLEYLAVTNEPDSMWPGECRFVDPQTYAGIVVRLGERLRNEGLHTRLVITDGITAAASSAYVDAVLQTPGAAGYVGAIAYHSYDGYEGNIALLEQSAQGQPSAHLIQQRRRLRDIAAERQWSVWMTEVCWCFAEGDRTEGRSDYELARLRLNHLYDELTGAGVQAFDIMNAYFIGFRRPDSLVEVRFGPGGSLESFELTNLGRMLGHFSTVVPPGSTRVYVDPAAEGAVRPIAFVRPDGTPAVILLNNTRTAVTVKIEFGGIRNLPATLPVLTSRESSMWQRAAVTVADGSVTVTVPGLGVASIATEMKSTGRGRG